MIKFRWYYDVDKEENFLNNMSKKGYYLLHYWLGFYKFKKINETDYIYRIDLINDKTEQEVHEYIQIVEESGAEFIQTWCKSWIYFRKRGQFELYTDIDSQIGSYNRIRTMFLTLGLSEGLVAISQWGIFICDRLSINLFVGIFISLISFLFLYQTSKLNKKISNLEKKKL